MQGSGEKKVSGLSLVKTELRALVTLKSLVPALLMQSPASHISIPIRALLRSSL
jgi:hypothetical protein